MSNKSSSKQHGLHSMNETRPKSKARKRKNKANARARREANPLPVLNGPKKVAKPKKAPAKAKAA